MQLIKHIGEKKSKVVGWDRVSIGSTVCGYALLALTLCQPRHPLNGIRIASIAVLATFSVVTERLRETDLVSLEKAQEYDKLNTSDRIRSETMLLTTAQSRARSEEIYQAIPQDEWGYIFGETGIAPPNLEMRKAIATPPQPRVEPAIGATGPVRMAVAEVDPTGSYDPEADAATEEPQFIFAHNVPAWLKSIGDGGASMRDEWTKKPGVGIKVAGDRAEIVYRENDHV
jgi:hypothetical protein